MISKLRLHLRGNKLAAGLLLYGIFYILAFFWLENRETPVHMVYSRWDGKIPFCEYFIVPYFLWFVYIACTVVYFLFICNDVRESRYYVLSFCVGMTVFLVVSYLYPNGHNLRPQIRGESLFLEAVEWLHRVDTSTNVLPSMHVYVTVVNSIALLRQPELRKRKGFVWFVLIISVLIILSTLFLKQHSVVDVMLALLLCIICYVLIYCLPALVCTITNSDKREYLKGKRI